MNTQSENVVSNRQLKPLSELSQRALAYYKENLQDFLEPREEGKGIAIHPDSGDYVVAETPTHASRAMRLKHPAGSFVTMRIGPSPDYALASRIIAGRIAAGQEL
jgi:hypothetical protein